MVTLKGFEIVVTTPEGSVLKWTEFSNATEASLRKEYEVRGNKVSVRPVTMEIDLIWPEIMLGFVLGAVACALLIPWLFR